jgi:flagellar capping protein FliD
MSDIYVPGLRSRFNSEQVVEDLMRLERIPRERAQNNVDRLEQERSYWQDISTRSSTLRESAGQLFSFQNPFNDRIVRSSDDLILNATATRGALEQERTFTVRQTAQADRFLSAPLENDFRVESGNYSFSVGDEEISFEFRGGNLRDFADLLNRRGRDLIRADLITVQPGTTSLLIESRVTGEENRLNFAGAAINLGEAAGILAPVYSNEDDAPVTYRPLNAVSSARDSIVTMEGIEIRRSGNEISDLVPGVTIFARTASDREVSITVEPNRELVKDAIISFVGNYNRLMAEINILTARNIPSGQFQTSPDLRVLEELTYLTREEREEYRNRLGAFSGDSTLMQLRNSLISIINTPVATSDEQAMAILAHLGIGSDPRRSGAGGADSSRLRGYLDIDERALDAAIATRLPAMRELFANSSTRDILPDTGIAFSVDALLRPYSETGGLFAQKAGGMGTRISQEQRRIETFDRQLASKEAELRRQYAQMEGAYNRMEQMSNSLERFQIQNNNNR